MFEINLTVSMSQDTLAAINNLAAALAGLNIPVPGMVTKSAASKSAGADSGASVAAVPEGFNEVVNDAQVPFQEEEKPAEPAAEEPAPAKEYTIDDIRNRVMALSRQGAAVKAKVKTALNKYADSVSHLKKTDYAAFMNDLEVL